MSDYLKKLGLGSTLDLYSSITKSMKAMNPVISPLTGLSNISEILNQQQAFKKSIGISSAIGLSAIHNMNKPLMNFDKQINPFLPLSSQLFQLVKQQEIVTRNMSALSVLSLSGSILRSVEFIKQQTIPDFSKALNGLASLQQKQSLISESLPKYLSNSLDIYLRQRIDTDDSEVESIVEDMQNVSSKLTEISENQKVTKEDVAYINSALKKQDTSAFIYFIIQIVLAILLSFNNEPAKQSNVNVTINNYEQEEVKKGFSETLKLLCLETRKAKTNVNLRNKPNSKSAKIGLINAGQIVLVQEINHKWIRIVYQDNEYMIQSGWVYKKCFERIN